MIKYLLVVYASKHGQAEKIARRIGEVARTPRMDAKVFDVKELPTDALDHCECVIVVGSVYFGRHSKALVEFVRTNRGQLTGMHAAFVSVSLAASQAEGKETAAENTAAFLKQTDWTPSRVEMFGGALAYSRYGLFKRWLIRRIARSKNLGTDTSRDYEYTDWRAVDAFARHFIAPGSAIRIA
jgi:menaquinone-dependent protoporphyrinogen oxidase